MDEVAFHKLGLSNWQKLHKLYTSTYYSIITLLLDGGSVYRRFSPPALNEVSLGSLNENDFSEISLLSPGGVPGRAPELTYDSDYN